MVNSEDFHRGSHGTARKRKEEADQDDRRRVSDDWIRTEIFTLLYAQSSSVVDGLFVFDKFLHRPDLFGSVADPIE